MTEQATVSLQAFELLASAMSGAPCRVAAAEPGEPTWTDGSTIFIDAAQSQREQLARLIVQASLLAAGSLAPGILRKLKRDPTRAKRYLAIEGQRALAANALLLPPWMQMHAGSTSGSNSAAASLQLAMSREPFADPPACFGIIRADRADTSPGREQAASAAGEHQHVPRRPQALAELAEDDDNDNGIAVDMFSLGGVTGVFGRWLQRLVGAARQGRADGNPGLDTATHRARRAGPAMGTRVWSTAVLDAAAEESAAQAGGTKYPEWDMHRSQYREHWCTVEEAEPSRKLPLETPTADLAGLHRPLARMARGFDRRRRQPGGDDIDIDAAIEARVELMAGAMPDENLYVDSPRRRRDLSVLVLLDVSGSAAESSSSGRTVHEQQCVAAAALVSTLEQLGDRVALYAYSSRGRSQVHMVTVKRFDTRFGAHAMQRLQRLEPSAYSRLGAAIRHGAAVLEQQGGTPRRLLLVLSDGLAYDHGYEKDYGAADARRALAEARRRGTAGLCVTIGASTNAESLRRVFGSAAHATIAQSGQLPDLIAPLFRSALRAAEVRRRLSARNRASAHPQ